MPHVTCPKAGCGWTVDPATTPAGGVITCPQCGQRFKLAAPSPSRRGEGVSSLLAIGGVLLAIAVVGGAIAAALVLKKNLGGKPVVIASASVRSEDKNFRFETPGVDWSPDAETKNALAVNVLAVRRTEPEAWAALAVKDYGTRVPLGSELRDAMTATLGRVFANLPPEPDLEATTWAGQPASVWRFRGEHRATGAVCAGEAVAMTHRGVGYWLYTWAAERDYDPAAFQPVRDGFKLLDGRANWQPTAGSEVTFRSQAGDYKLSAYEKIWDMVPSPEGGAELELKGVHRTRGKRDFPPRAEVRVWRAAEAGDPTAVADAVVRKEFTRDAETFGPTEFTDLTEPPAGDVPPGPDTAPAALVKRFKVSYGSDEAGRSRKLVVSAAAKAGDRVVVAVGSCPWDEREVWERRLVQLVGSLK